MPLVEKRAAWEGLVDLVRGFRRVPHGDSGGLRGSNDRASNIWGSNIWGSNTWGSNIWRDTMRRLPLAASVIGVIIIPCFFMSVHSANPNIVSQKGQQFNPRQASVYKGTTIAFVNDDGDLIHHVYVASRTFNYDSGDQEPGATKDITFTVLGSFVVLCAIHPKMRFDVTVH